MPVTWAYPGAYIEEASSGGHSITGVASSITVFVGRAVRGPADEPITVSSFREFERIFGGLAVNYPMSYAVRDFYVNGGRQATILRLYKAPVHGDGVARLAVGCLKLKAGSPGEWGNKLRITVDHSDITNERADHYGLDKADLFNLTVEDGSSGTVEAFRYLSVKDGKDASCRVDRVLARESRLVRVQPKPNGTPDLPTAPPGDETSGAEGGKDSTALQMKDFEGDEQAKTGLYALEKGDLFNLLCIPPDTRGGDMPSTVYQAAMTYCRVRRAMLIVDPPASWSKKPETAAREAKEGLAALGLSGADARNAALYFPRVVLADPLRGGQRDTFVPCGIVAGVLARTDERHGVWKAPAGIDATLKGVQELEVNLTGEESAMLNSLGINCLRTFPGIGQVVWGARTLRGADQLRDEYKYVPVRRLALFVEESLYRGTQWVLFEPNDEPLWAQIRLKVGAFMHNLFRQGAFAGRTPREAYFVKCDKETTTQTDIERGIVNILVGFAPLKSAEFMIIKISQVAGQIQA